MNVVISIDSLKGSLSSIEAGNAIKQGILRVEPNTSVKVLPLADGGEGTTAALSEGMGGTMHTVEVCGPLGAPVMAQYCILNAESSTSKNSDTQTPEAHTRTLTAIIEISAAAGITLVPREQLNPLKATTYGVGEMIKDAIQKGCRRFIIGIGGSATNDCGIGMLQALGFVFTDKNGVQIPDKAGAATLADVCEISSENVLPELKECEFNVACDVSNPLCGEQGCSKIYGPQKGATPEMIEQMDKWIARFAKIATTINTTPIATTHTQARTHTHEFTPTFTPAFTPELMRTQHNVPDPDFPGSGAAGGLGFAFRTFTNAELKPGIDLVLAETNLEYYIKDADLVFTGEGRLDGQTAMGKAPVGVAKLAKKYGKPVIALAGCVTPDAVKCHEQGIDAFFPILRGITTLDEAMETLNAANNMSATAEEVFRLWTCAINR